MINQLLVFDHGGRATKMWLKFNAFHHESFPVIKNKAAKYKIKAS